MNAPASEFQQLYTGRLWSVMSWDQLAAFWRRIDPAAGWYLYSAGVSSAPTLASAEQVAAFLTEVDALLRADHRESYCGIVYTDDLEAPRLVKIYDPNHLGSSCGSSKHEIPPGWLMSRVPPDGLVAARPAPEGRRRWWQRLMGMSGKDS